MKVILAILLLSAAGAAEAATLPAPLRHSKHFSVVDGRPATEFSPGRLKSKSGADLLRLDIDVLLLSAERIREVLVFELGPVPFESAGKIHLALFTARRPDELIRVVSTISPSGWDYQVAVPDQIEGQALVRSVVHSVLLEVANRGQGPRSAELPLWLVEGLTAHLMAVGGADLVVGAVPIGSMLRIVRERRGLDYLENARRTLVAQSPLSFLQLSSARPGDLVGDKLQAYQASAQLFVYELLHVAQGQTCLVQMLRQLPNCWNWETALLRAFSAEFKRMLDVEKKWSVDALAFTAADPSQVWSRVVCLDRLDEVLSVPAQIRVSADTLPERKRINLQEMISDWPSAAQTAVLKQKLSLLNVLRFHSSAELVPLIDSYSQVLATYLIKRDLAGKSPETRMHSTPNVSFAVQEAVRELETLDKRREALRPEKVLSVNSP